MNNFDNNFEQLRNVTKDEQQALQASPIIRRALAGQVSVQEYLAFLAQAYHHVKHTVPLLMACGARLPFEKEWLRVAIAHYITEETGHQEWILDDITACGGDAHAVRLSQPSMATELMVAYAYDSIARGNPVGFFGMVYVLEGTSVQLATHAASTLKLSLQLPDAAFSYLNSHGSLDVSHVSFFRDLINKINSSDDLSCVVHAAKVFFRLYGDIFNTLDSEL